MKNAPLRALIVADGDVVTATVEAALRDRPDVQVEVGRLQALRRLIDEGDPTVVVLASTAARAAAALQAIVGMLRVPPIVLLVDDPAAAWTAACSRAIPTPCARGRQPPARPPSRRTTR